MHLMVDAQDILIVVFITINIIIIWDVFCYMFRGGILSKGKKGKVNTFVHVVMLCLLSLSVAYVLYFSSL